MKVWFVDCEDISAVFDSWEKAYDYLMDNKKRCEWEQRGSEDCHESHGYAVYDFKWSCGNKSGLLQASITEYTVNERADGEESE